MEEKRMTQKNKLDFKRIACAITTSEQALDAIQRQPIGYYTKRRLTSELAPKLGPGRASRRAVGDGIDWLQKITAQIEYRHKNGEEKGDYYIYARRVA
jgi:hypothetical protein